MSREYIKKKRNNYRKTHGFSSYVVSIIAKGINDLWTPHHTNCNCTLIHRKEHTNRISRWKRRRKSENAAKPLPFVGLLFTLVHTIYVSWSNNFEHFILSSDMCSAHSAFHHFLSRLFHRITFFFLVLSLSLRWFIVTPVHWKHNSVRKCDDNPKPFICNQTHIPWKR